MIDKLLDPAMAIWGIGSLLYLGALHQMVRSNNKAIGRLFDELKEARDFQKGQERFNEFMKSDVEKIERQIADHQREAGERYGSLSARIDQLLFKG